MRIIQIGRKRAPKIGSTNIGILDCSTGQSEQDAETSRPPSVALDRMACKFMGGG